MCMLLLIGDGSHGNSYDLASGPNNHVYAIIIAPYLHVARLLVTEGLPCYCIIEILRNNFERGPRTENYD